MTSELLAQLRPSTTNAESFIDPAEGIVLVEITDLLIVNNHSSGIIVSVFLDEDGVTWDETNRILHTTVGANDYVREEFRRGVSIPEAGSMAVQAATVDEVVFTAFGRNVESASRR